MNDRKPGLFQSVRQAIAFLIVCAIGAGFWWVVWLLFDSVARWTLNL